MKKLKLFKTITKEDKEFEKLRMTHILENGKKAKVSEAPVYIQKIFKRKDKQNDTIKNRKIYKVKKKEAKKKEVKKEPIKL